MMPDDIEGIAGKTARQRSSMFVNDGHLYSIAIGADVGGLTLPGLSIGRLVSHARDVVVSNSGSGKGRPARSDEALPIDSAVSRLAPLGRKPRSLLGVWGLCRLGDTWRCTRRRALGDCPDSLSATATGQNNDASKKESVVSHGDLPAFVGETEQRGRAYTSRDIFFEINQRKSHDGKQPLYGEWCSEVPL